MPSVNSCLFVSVGLIIHFFFRVCQPENCLFVCVQPGPVSRFFLDLCQHDRAAGNFWQRWENIGHFHVSFALLSIFHKNSARHIISDTFLISDSLYDTFHSMSDVMFFCQILAAVEVLNAAFGIVRTGVVPTLIQVWVKFVWVLLGSWCNLTLHGSKIFSFCRLWEGTLSSSSFLEVWRKCTTSLLCSLSSIFGVLLRLLGK